MARKRDVFDFFKDNQHRLDEAPSAQSWRRLERRLDTHQRRNRLSRYRVLGMAAGVLILVTLVGLVALSLGRQQRLLLAANEQASPSALEDLTVADAGSSGLRTVLAVQNAQEHRRQLISEGAPGQKLVPTGNGAQRQAGGSMTLRAFDWMIGRWQSNEQGRSAFEEWSRTNDDEIAGVAFLDKDEQHREHMRLFKEGNKVFFSTDFGGASPVVYTLMAINGEEALFENPDTGFPQQVRLQRHGNNRMAAIYQNAEPQLPDTDRAQSLMLRHTIQPMQAVRRMGKVSLQ